MKQLSFLTLVLSVLMLATSCSNSKTENVAENENEPTIVNQMVDDNTIQVLYFHGSIRCKTCVAVGDSTEHYVKSLFPEQVESGEIVFKTLNLEDEENLVYVELYELYGQTMLFIKGETVLNETEDAFKYVVSKPEAWKATVENSIVSLMS